MGSVGFIVIGLAAIISVTLIIVRVLDIREDAEKRLHEYKCHPHDHLSKKRES